MKASPFTLIGRGLWSAGPVVVADHRVLRAGWTVRWTVTSFGGAFEERRERSFPTKAAAFVFARALLAPR